MGDIGDSKWCEEKSWDPAGGVGNRALVCAMRLLRAFAQLQQAARAGRPAEAKGCGWGRGRGQVGPTQVAVHSAGWEPLVHALVNCRASAGSEPAACRASGGAGAAAGGGRLAEARGAAGAHSR